MLEYKCIFSNKIYGSNFIELHSETVRAYGLKLAYQKVNCAFNNNSIVLFIIIFGTLSLPIVLRVVTLY